MGRPLRVAVLLGIAITFWEWRIISPAATSGPISFVFSDLYTQYIPVLSRAAAELRYGHLPQWNPDQLAGTPAIPSWFTFGAFYPLNVLYLLLPAHIALGWTTCLHLAVAGGGMYWLAIVLGLSAAAAWFAAAVYMLCPTCLYFHHPNLLHATALAPAVLAAWLRLLTRPASRRDLGVTAGVTALQLSSGGLQICVYTFYAISVVSPFAAQRVACERRPWRALWRSLAAGVLACGLVAVVLLPTVAHSALSARKPAGLTLADTVPLPTPTLRQLALQLISPAPGLPRAFFGWAALALAALGACRTLLPAASQRRANPPNVCRPQAPRRKLAVGFLLLLLVGVALVLGPNTPAYAWYYRLPTGSWFRSPERGVILMAVGIAVLAALGVEEFHRRGWRRVARVLVLLPLIEQSHATWNTFPHPQARGVAVAPPASIGRMRTRLGFERAFIVQNWEDRFPYMEKLGTWCRLPIAQDYDQLTPAVYGDYFRALVGRRSIIDEIFAGRYHPPAYSERVARRALDMLAVRWLIVAPGRSFAWGGLPSTADDGAVLFENPSALPRAFIVHRVEAVADAGQALRRIAQFGFDPSSTAVVVGAPSLDLPPRTADEDEGVEVRALSPDTVTVQVHLQRAGLLVLNDALLPGWSARVDDRETEIVPANGLFRGVYLEAGQHVVGFTYELPMLTVGAWVSGASAVAVLLLLWSPWRAS